MPDLEHQNESSLFSVLYIKYSNVDQVWSVMIVYYKVFHKCVIPRLVLPTFPDNFSGFLLIYFWLTTLQAVLPSFASSIFLLSRAFYFHITFV